MVDLMRDWLKQEQTLYSHRFNVDVRFISFRYIELQRKLSYSLHAALRTRSKLD
jgi:hypothetical protein